MVDELGLSNSRCKEGSVAPYSRQKVHQRTWTVNYSYRLLNEGFCLFDE